MKSLKLVILAVLLSSLPTKVLAEKLAVELTPRNVRDHGFSVETAKREDGTIDVTLTRDLSKARSFDSASELELVRSVHLEVRGSAGLIARCRLEREEAKGSAVYRFQLAAENFERSRLSVWEIDDYKKRAGREHLLGGGTIFELRLADWIKQ